MESNPRTKSKLSREQGKEEYPNTIPVLTLGFFQYKLTPEAPDNPSWIWEREKQGLNCMSPYPIHEQ